MAQVHKLKPYQVRKCEESIILVSNQHHSTICSHYLENNIIYQLFLNIQTYTIGHTHCSPLPLVNQQTNFVIQRKKLQ